MLPGLVAALILAGTLGVSVVSAEAVKIRAGWVVAPAFGCDGTGWVEQDRNAGGKPGPFRVLC